MPPTDDETRAFDAPPLRLTFRWDGARWSHGLAVSGRTIATSVESDPDRGDPDRAVSPAYQQLLDQESDAGTQALLVGQWGRHHGSVVFTLSATESAASVAADLAVRSGGALAFLAATYLVDLASGDLVDAGPSGIVWSLGGPEPGRLRFEPAAGATVGLAEAGRRATRVQVLSEVTTGRNTHRFGYSWCWERDASR